MYFPHSEIVLFCPSKRKPLGLKSTPTQSQMTALLPSLLHHVCMDEMGHYIIAEKASTNWQTTAFAGLLSDLILTMTKLHNYVLWPQRKPVAGRCAQRWRGWNRSGSF